MSTDDRKELESLRLGIARLAMSARLTVQIPGLGRLAARATQGDDPGLAELLEAVKTEERGWNKLLAGILGVIQDGQQDREYVVALENDNAQLAVDRKRALDVLEELHDGAIDRGDAYRFLLESGRKKSGR